VRWIRFEPFFGVEHVSPASGSVGLGLGVGCVSLSGSGGGGYGLAVAEAQKHPIRVLADRVLVQYPNDEGERRSRGGILIPATAQMNRRLVWAEVVAVGPNVRTVEVSELVLFSPEDRFEVEVRGEEYVLLRERDIHAVASERSDAGTGLYL